MASFSFFTGVSDKNIAKSLLSVCQGNLEMAINMQMEGGIQEQQQPGGATGASSAQGGDEEDDGE